MRPSLRFLVIAMAGWTGVRMATLGTVPGGALTLTPLAARAAPRPSAIVPTEFPALPAVARAIPQAASAMIQPVTIQYVVGPAPGYASPRPLVVPVYYRYQGQDPPPVHYASYTPILPAPRPNFYSRVPQLDEWPLSRIAATSMPARTQTATAPMQTPAPAIAARLDRIQLTMWAMLRSRPGAIGSPTSLASGGTLGGSQAGARLFYNISPSLAVVLRSSSDVGRRGGEVAAGIRYRPIRTVPVWLTAERRQALGRYGGGRSDFALFAEGGVYDRPAPLGFLLDGYAQAGVVGISSRDLFADGGFTLTKPIFGRFSAGFGVWGGVQPGLYRVDAGPRLTMRVRRNVKVHLDWRQRLSGNALPGSGPALTLAGDF
jgi:hypothetical protein